MILNGLEKVEIREYITTEPYFRARVTALRDTTPDLKSVEFEALVDSIRDVALNIINVSPSMPKEAAFAIKNIDSKRGIINFICSNMELTDEDRQSLLEAPGLLARARKLLEILIREQQLAELKNQIQERVKQEIEDILAIPAEDAPEISAKQGINIPAVLEVMKFIYDHIIYAELNTKSDYCQVCGWDGEIQIVEEDGKLIWKCPRCGNTDQDKMNVARRTCGYIGTQFWNQGRTQEIKDRVLHL